MIVTRKISTALVKFYSLVSPKASKNILFVTLE
jgi:hypothetical protein